MAIAIPPYVLTALNLLCENGYEAYAVGGCVRDSLLGRTPDDWDICTSARPEQMQAVFETCRVIPTGIQHGTVTVILEKPLEITTYRIDGDYLDCRRPEQVTFTDSLTEDLARRDFTVNAMALSRDGEIIDPFGGQADLENRRIRCVGNADERFDEDALRIMRAMRFSSTLGFTIEKETSRAIHEKKENLSRIAAERIQAELTKMLGGSCEQVLVNYADVLRVILPEVMLTKSKARQINMASALPLRLALLTQGCDCEAILRRLRYPKAIIAQAAAIGGYPVKKLCVSAPVLRRLLGQCGERISRDVLEFAFLTGALTVTDYAKCKRLLMTIILRSDCVTTAQLALSGKDLTSAFGVKGRTVGKLLKLLLEAVMDEKVKNKAEELLKYAETNLNY